MVSSDSVKPKILIISGPTAIGKSAAAIDIAQKFDGEIISADSMQVYEHLNIGTGKLKKEEMLGIKHHLIDIKKPNESYSVSEFVDDAKSKITKIIKNCKLPIIVGGTGLYINALINGFSFSGTSKSDELRQELEGMVTTQGLPALYDRLYKIDVESAKKISVNDKKRIIRALEIFYLSGKPKSESIDASTNSEFDYLFFVMDDEREKIYDRINKRVDLMFGDGLVDEVEGLLEYKGCQSMQAIGYKEVVGFIFGDKNYEETLDSVKQNSRHYAKRQLTYLRWLKAEKVWIKASEFNKYYDCISKFK